MLLCERATRGARAGGCNSRGSCPASSTSPLSHTRRLAWLCADLGRAVPAEPGAVDDAPRRSGAARRARCAEAEARRDPPTFLPGRLGRRTLPRWVGGVSAEKSRSAESFGIVSEGCYLPSERVYIRF